MAELQDSSFCMLIICMLWLFCASYSKGMFVLQSNVLAVADNLVYGPCFCLVWKWTSPSADTPLVSIYLGQEALEFEAAEFRMAFTAGLPHSLLPLPALAFKSHTFELKSSTLLIWELKYECQSLVDCASFNDFSTDSLSDFEWVRRSRSQQSWITPSSKQLSPSPIILLSSDHILEAIVTSVFPPIIITQSCRNDLQLLQSAWKLSDLTHFGRPPSLEIKSWVFFQWERDFSMWFGELSGGFQAPARRRGGGGLLAVSSGCPFEGWYDQSRKAESDLCCQMGCFAQDLTIPLISPFLGVLLEWKMATKLMWPLHCCMCVFLCTTLEMLGWWLEWEKGKGGMGKDSRELQNNPVKIK